MFVALAAAAVWFRVWEPFPRVSVVGIVAAIIGGYPIFKEAFENIVERKMTMELSMTIALVSALAIGEFFTALVITAFVVAAEVCRSRRNSNQDRNQGCRYAVPSPDNLTKRIAKAVRSCCLRLIILWEPNVGRDSDAIFRLYI